MRLGTPGSLAIIRVAWRQLRRTPGRSALVVVLVLAPTLLLALVGSSLSAAQPRLSDQVAQTMGNADIRVNAAGGLSPASLAPLLPPSSEVEAIQEGSVDVVRSGQLYDVHLAAPSSPATKPVYSGMFRLLSEKAPSAPDEVAVQPDLLKGLGSHVGGRIQLGSFALRVTGVVVLPQQLQTSLAVLGPGGLEGASSSTTFLIRLPPGSSSGAAAAALGSNKGLAVLRRQDVVTATSGEASGAAGTIFVLAVLAQLGAGLISGAAFVVGARRQMRTHGLILALGGDDRHVRRLVLATGVLLGAVGAGLGACLGVLGSLLARPALAHFDHRIPGPVRVDLPWVGASFLLGVTAATVAAGWPARSAARVSVMRALSGRDRPPRPPGRLAGVGAAALVAGIGGTVIGMRASAPPLLAAALVATVVGCLMGIPALLTGLGRCATFLPAAARIAARDAARYARRTGAAIAAATLVLALPVSLSAFSLSEEHLSSTTGPLAKDQIVIRGPASALASTTGGALVDSLRWSVPDAVVARVSSPDVRAMVDQLGQGPNGSTYTSLVSVPVVIGGGDLLNALHAGPGATALDHGEVVTLGSFLPDNGTASIIVGNAAGTGTAVPAVAVRGLAYLDSSEVLPAAVMSPTTAEALGVATGRGWLLMRLPRSVTSNDRETVAAALASAPGFYLKTAADYQPPWGLVRASALGASSLAALGIVAVALALVASEARRSRLIVASLGAGPMMRRAAAMWSAAFVSLTAALLALPLGLIPFVLVEKTRPVPRPLVIPWTAIVIVCLAIPAITGLGAALLAQVRDGGIQGLQVFQE